MSARSGHRYVVGKIEGVPSRPQDLSNGLCTLITRSFEDLEVVGVRLGCTEQLAKPSDLADGCEGEIFPRVVVPAQEPCMQTAIVKSHPSSSVVQRSLARTPSLRIPLHTGQKAYQGHTRTIADQAAWSSGRPCDALPRPSGEDAVIGMVCACMSRKTAVYAYPYNSGPQCRQGRGARPRAHGLVAVKAHAVRRGVSLRDRYRPALHGRLPCARHVSCEEESTCRLLRRQAAQGQARSLRVPYGCSNMGESPCVIPQGCPNATTVPSSRPLSVWRARARGAGETARCLDSLLGSMASVACPLRRYPSHGATQSEVSRRAHDYDVLKEADTHATPMQQRPVLPLAPWLETR
jgi:hypothetical protein